MPDTGMWENISTDKSNKYMSDCFKNVGNKYKLCHFDEFICEYIGTSASSSVGDVDINCVCKDRKILSILWINRINKQINRWIQWKENEGRVNSK